MTTKLSLQVQRRRHHTNVTKTLNILDRSMCLHKPVEEIRELNTTLEQCFQGFCDIHEKFHTTLEKDEDMHTSELFFLELDGKCLDMIKKANTYILENEVEITVDLTKVKNDVDNDDTGEEIYDEDIVQVNYEESELESENNDVTNDYDDEDEFVEDEFMDGMEDIADDEDVENVRYYGDDDEEEEDEIEIGKFLVLGISI